MIVKLLTEHHLEFLSLSGGCTDSPESTYVKMPHCWKLHVKAQIFYLHESHSTISVTEVNTWCYISTDQSSVGTLGGVMILT